MTPFSPEPTNAPGASQRRAEYALYKVAAAYVWATLRRLRVPEEDREDVAQRILVAAYDKRGDYDPKLGSMARWLHGFAVNFARRYGRENSKREHVPLDDVPEALFATSRPEDRGMAEEHREFLYKELLGKLPFELRAAVIARDLDELEFQDIARLHEVSLSTAYDRYRRGRAALDRAYERWRRDQEARGLGLLPFTAAQLFEADRPIPGAPADVEQALWGRLQRVRLRASTGAFRERPWVGIAAAAVAGMAAGAALHAAARPEPRERVSIVEVPVPVLVAPAIAAESGMNGSTEIAAASAPVSSSTSIAARTGGAGPMSRTGSASSAGPAGSADPVLRDLLEEQRIFEAARQAWKRGDMEATLASLDRLARSYPNGNLASEREELWIQVLARNGKLDDARARLDRLRGTPEGRALMGELDTLVPAPSASARATPGP